MSIQACIDASSRKDAAKVHAQLLPVAAKAANDPAPDVREANMRVLVAFAVKSGNLGLLDKVLELEGCYMCLLLEEAGP